LKSLGAKKNVKIVFFDASQAQNHGIYGVFCSWYQKPRYLQCFVAGTLQKQWYLRSFQHVARSTFSMPKALTPDEKRQKNVRKQPKVSKMELLFQPSKTREVGPRLFELSPGRLRPHLPKTQPNQSLPPPTPPRLASLRFAYTYTQPRPSAGFRNHVISHKGHIIT